jgi:GDP-L-fucose synthase
LAKRMLLVQARAYRDEYGFNCVVVIPTNLYGPGDNADPQTSHVIPAIIRKCIEARDSGAAEVVLWGTGVATREFLHVDDAAEAIALALERYDRGDPLNLGTDHEISIKELADLIAQATGFEGSLTWDASQPDGQPTRRVDASRARDALGWTPRIALEDGLRDVVRQFDSAATLR